MKKLLYVIFCGVWCNVNASEPPVLGRWISNASLSVSVSRPAFEYLPDEKRVETLAQLGRLEIEFGSEKISIIDSVAKINNTFKYEIKEFKNHTLIIEILDAAPDSQWKTVQIHFLGENRFWIKGVRNSLEFFDRKK